jgi:heme O synthase-like polyprenyltransferase
MGGGVLGLVMAVGLGGYLLYRALLMRRTNETREAWGMFGYSIVYLLVLFVVFMVDATIDAPWNTLPLPGR